MTSERQKAANRANALHSTGPKTPEGKAAVRLNAFRHGLLARDVVLPGEDAGRLRGSLEPGSGKPLADGAGSRNFSWTASSTLCGGSGAWHGWRPRSSIGGCTGSRRTGSLAQVCSYEKEILPTDFASQATSRTKRAHGSERRRLGALKTSGTGTRSSSDGRSMPTPKRATPSASSPATKGAWNGRSFGISTSSASARTNAGIVPRRRFWMPLRSTQAIQNDFRSTHSRERARSTQCAPAFYCSEN